MIAMLSWTLVAHASASCCHFPSPHVVWLSLSTCWLGCALCFIMFHFYLHYTFYWSNSFPIEAMEMKQPDAQESQELPVPPEVPPPASAPASSTTETLTPEEMELIKKHRAATRASSPTKKPRTDQGWEEFLSALSAKDVELSDLDFGLQQELRASPPARADFLALNITTPDALHYDPGKGKLEKIDLTKNRPFTDLQSVETPKLEIQEAQVKGAMLQYHKTTFLPNHRFLLEACRQFSSNTILEQYHTQIPIDPMDSRIKTLKAKLGNKFLLLRRLPATGFTKNNPDWNLKYFCELAKVLNLFLLWANISSSQTPTSSDLNLSLRTENQRTRFFTCQAEQTRLGIPAEEVQSQSGITF